MNSLLILSLCIGCCQAITLKFDKQPANQKATVGEPAFFPCIFIPYPNDIVPFWAIGTNHHSPRNYPVSSLPSAFKSNKTGLVILNVTVALNMTTVQCYLHYKDDDQAKLLSSTTGILVVSDQTFPGANAARISAESASSASSKMLSLTVYCIVIVAFYVLHLDIV